MYFAALSMVQRWTYEYSFLFSFCDEINVKNRWSYSQTEVGGYSRVALPKIDIIFQNELWIGLFKATVSKNVYEFKWIWELKFLSSWHDFEMGLMDFESVPWLLCKGLHRHKIKLCIMADRT